MEKPEYAGFWLRFIAYLLDSFVLSAIQTILVIPFMIALGIQFISEPFNFEMYEVIDEDFMEDFMYYVDGTIPLIIGGYIAQVLYFSLLESSHLQASLGKMILRIKVTDANGERLTFLPSLIRNIGKIVSGLIFLIGYIMAAFTKKKQALHDFFAGALVVRK